MKPYVKLECAELTDISAGIYEFIVNSTDLLTTGKIGWHFVDHKQLLRAVPELLRFFSDYKLVPTRASVVILTESGQLPVHVDELPVVAKVNFPVSNTKGWINRWFTLTDNTSLQEVPKVINQFGSEIEALTALPPESFVLLEEIWDLDCPIVFNSRIPHDVIKYNGDSPRIIASFTFLNEPIGFLE